MDAVGRAKHQRKGLCVPLELASTAQIPCSETVCLACFFDATHQSKKFMTSTVLVFEYDLQSTIVNLASL